MIVKQWLIKIIDTCFSTIVIEKRHNQCLIDLKEKTIKHFLLSKYNVLCYAIFWKLFPFKFTKNICRKLNYNFSTTYFYVNVKTKSSGVFKNNINLKRLIVKAVLDNKISDEFCCNCFKLEEIVLPDSITHIGKFAFKNCISLKTVKLPKTIEYISQSAFENCISLTSIAFYKKHNEKDATSLE